MSTCREAVQHARGGGTSRFGGKEIRFLTFEEAEPLILEQCPSRRVVIDTREEVKGKPNPNCGRAIIGDDGNIIVETYADPNFDTKRLGLYDVGVHPAVPAKFDDEDMHMPVELDEEGKEKPRVFRTDWVREGVDDKPAVVAPETVDAALAETEPL